MASNGLRAPTIPLTLEIQIRVKDDFALSVDEVEQGPPFPSAPLPVVIGCRLKYRIVPVCRTGGWPLALHRTSFDIRRSTS
jgi:hypothetical protein